jgi:hypothetical protein
MTSVGVALVNGVRVPGYLFAPGFVGDGSQLANVHTSNVTHANVGQLAYYVDSTTIGGNPGLSFENDTLTVNGNLYVSGTTVSSNNVAYENSVLSIGTKDFDAFTKGLLFVNSHANVMISYTNVLTIGYTHNSANDFELFPVDGEDIQVNILGNVSVLGTVTSKNFIGDGSLVSNTVDIPPGTYGDGLLIPQVTIGQNGRPSLINLITIQSSLESVTNFGTTTSKSIQFENEGVSLTTHGSLGIANSNPSSLLCVGEGVRVSDRDATFTGDVTAKNFYGNGAALMRTTDAQYGQYGNSLNTIQITIDKNGRLSQIDQIPIKSNLDTVTRNGSLSKSTIQLEHADISMTTTGKVGIGNQSPTSLLCIGPSTRFDENDLFMVGNVSAKNFFGNAFQLTNTSDVKPGSYGGGSIVPQIVIDKNGRMSSIELTQVFMTLDQVTLFNSSTGTTIHLLNKGVGLTSDGDIQVNYGKDVVWLNSFGNPVCTIGQRSEVDSRVAHFCGSQVDSLLDISNWESVSINSGVSIDSSGRTTMNGCFMKSGTGYTMNAQQFSGSLETLSLSSKDLFNWFSFGCSASKTVQLPDPTVCQAGSWIGITNASSTSNVQVFDTFGTTLYAVIKPSEFSGGKSKRLMCVSSLAPANGTNVMGTVWVVA